MKNPHEFHVGRIIFLGEQDGPPEHVLKEKLIESFRQNPNVLAAFLSQVSFSIPSQSEVALCLKTHLRDNERLATEIEQIFGTIFGSHEHLNIIFLNGAQEIEINKMCKPFFLRK